MAPLVGSFHPSRLEEHVNVLPNGKVRKQTVDLKQCELKELMQYACDIVGPKGDKRNRIQCREVLRLFRQCANGLTVEVTSWEDVYDGKEGKR